MSSTLTPNQRRIAYQIQEQLKDRPLVYLSGRSNGKTRIITRLQENELRKERSAKGASITMTKRSDRDTEIVFVKDVCFPADAILTPTNIKRQVLQAFDMQPKRSAVYVEQAFRALLKQLNDNGQVMCLTFDNAELISRRGFTVLKALNEIRAGGKDVGPAVLLAAEQYIVERRMPFAFRKRTIEIPLGKIDNPEDILDMIENNWPGMGIRFQNNPKAMERIMYHGTTLEQAGAAREAVREMRRLRVDQVDEKFVPTAALPKAA